MRYQARCIRGVLPSEGVTVGPERDARGENQTRVAPNAPRVFTDAAFRRSGFYSASGRFDVASASSPTPAVSSCVVPSRPSCRRALSQYSSARPSGLPSCSQRWNASVRICSSDISTSIVCPVKVSIRSEKLQSTQSVTAPSSLELNDLGSNFRDTEDSS